MECNREKNQAVCNCSYSACSRRHVCCECIAYHRRNHELPACYFPAEAEKTYDRSIEYFVSLFNKGKI